MIITDAQVHIWGPDTPARPWSVEEASANDPASVSVTEIIDLMDEAGVDRCILVPRTFEDDRNEVCLEAAATYPARLAVMGRIPLSRRDAAESALAGWKLQPGMLGVRFTFSKGPASDWLDDGTADWVWPVLEREGIPVMMAASGKLDRVARVAADHPALRLVIDHFGLSTWDRDDAIHPRIAALIALAQIPNIAVKASCLPNYVSDEYPFKSLHEPIERVVNAFGPERVFWGSDITRSHHPYRQQISLFTEELSFLSAKELALIMGEALSKWVGWPPDAGGPQGPTTNLPSA